MDLLICLFMYFFEVEIQLLNSKTKPVDYLKLYLLTKDKQMVSIVNIYYAGFCTHIYMFVCVRQRNSDLKRNWFNKGQGHVFLKASTCEAGVQKIYEELLPPKNLLTLFFHLHSGMSVSFKV